VQQVGAAIVRCFLFRQKFTPDDAIGSHTCSLEALARVRPMAFLSSVRSSLLPVDTLNSVTTRKACTTPCLGAVWSAHPAFCHHTHDVTTRKAEEAKPTGIDRGFSPVLHFCTDPRFGR
jgi:hypothetical protein